MEKVAETTFVQKTCAYKVDEIDGRTPFYLHMDAAYNIDKRHMVDGEWQTNLANSDKF